MSVMMQSVSSLLHKATGQSIDPEQLAYFIGLYTSLASSYFVKYKLQQSNVSKSVQLYIIGCIGLWIYYSIWGLLVALPVIEVMISYFMMIMLPTQQSTRFVFIFAMLFLSLCHIYMVYLRIFALDKYHSSDFTGPIMIITQRIIGLAYSVYDGTKPVEQLNEIQKKYSLSKLPSFPEFFAYMFSFTGITCGPFAWYHDIMPFLQRNETKKSDSSQPSSARAVLAKVTSSMFFIYLFWVGTDSYACRKNSDQSFIDNHSILERFVYLYISLFLARAKYYGAWLFADAVHNVMGIGFNGYDDHGKSRWNQISNVNIINIEFATGLKSYVDNWNLMTAKWIRYVAYDRLPSRYRTLGSFLLSAFWHGFFPGYYIMFLTCHGYLILQRKARRTIRPFFQSSSSLRHFYDILTLLLTQLGISYAALSFVLLEWSSSFRFYRSVWFIGHVIVLALLLLIPSPKNSEKQVETLPVEVKNNGGPPTETFLGNLNNGHGHVRQR